MAVYRLDCSVNEYSQLYCPSIVRDCSYFDTSLPDSLWSTAPLPDDWEMPTVFADDELKHFGDVSMILTGHGFVVFSSRAVDTIRPLVETCGRFLSMPSPDGEFWFFHCEKLLRSTETSEFRAKYWPTPGDPRTRPMRISELFSVSIDSSVLRSFSMFRIEQGESLGLFVSDAFVNIFTAAHLTGATFAPICNEAKSKAKSLQASAFLEKRQAKQPRGRNER